MRYDSIVVGGGIAGLTSAAYLAKAGQKVLLIEKNHECGGLVNTFSHNGFYFDAGVRALEDAGIIFPMLAQLGITLEMVKSPVSVGVEDKVVDIGSIDDYRELLISQYPKNIDEIDAVLKVIKKIMSHMDVLYGIENPLFKDLKNDFGYIFKRLLPWLPKFIFTVGKINSMNMPVEAFLDTMITNPSLKDIMSQHFFKNTPTFFALSYISLFLDYFYPKGGVGTIANAVHDKILEFGGEILVDTKIIDIDADDKFITDDKGVIYHYEDLIWAADLKTFYTHVKSENMRPKAAQKFAMQKRDILSSRGGDSIFSLFLEVDLPVEYFKEIANGHFFYTPSKVGLGETHRTQLDALLANWDDSSKQKVFEWLEKFTTLNTYEISIPALKDAALAPENKTGVIISFLAEFYLFERIFATDWYDEFKRELERRVIDVITDSIYPMLKENIIGSFSFSPLSIQDRVGSSEGAITGWSFVKAVPVVNKIQFSDSSVQTPIRSIYQAGQWAFSPAGVPMSILTGKLASDQVLKKSR